MNYSKKLSHPRWQRRRLERLSEENFSCQICSNEDEELHVHHLYYDKGKDIWEYPNKALVASAIGNMFSNRSEFKATYENFKTDGAR